MPAAVVEQPFGEERTELTESFSRYASRRWQETPQSTMRDYYLHIDSGSRNPIVYPNRSSFRWELTEPLRDVVSIEVLTLAVPNINNLIAEPYVLLDLGQLNTWEAGVNRTSTFQVLYAAQRVNWWPSQTPPDPLDSNAAQGLIIFDKKSAERSPTIYYPSKPRMSDLNITLRNRLGQQLDLGNDPNLNSVIVQADCQWSMTLKIQCAVPPALPTERFGT